jgi:hypothetical protein
MTMKLRLATKHDALTADEQADLDRQLSKMLARHDLRYEFHRNEVENIARLHATLSFYRALMDTRGIDYAAALPRRVRRNGIDYIQDVADEE